MGTSKISVDLGQRTFDIEVPDENVADVLEQLGRLFDRLPPLANHASLEIENDAQAAGPISEEGETQGNSVEEKSKRKRGAGKGVIKTRAYELIDLGLTQSQRVEMQKFFSEKDPKGQNDQVAVLAVKLKELKGNSALSIDEIHSAFKVVNKPTPRNLTAVLGNMKRDGKGGYTDNKLVVNSFTEDHVAFHMNAKEKEKK